MPRTKPRRTRFSGFRVDFSPMEQHRNKVGMTRAQVAQAVGVDASTIYRLERNRQSPTYDLVVACARAIGFPETDLRRIVDLP